MVPHSILLQGDRSRGDQQLQLALAGEPGNGDLMDFLFDFLNEKFVQLEGNSYSLTPYQEKVRSCDHHDRVAAAALKRSRDPGVEGDQRRFVG